MALLATYRLQLRGGIRLATATRLVPYLRDLGISHLYLSPILRARRGSTHGYDVVDPGMLDPALGSERDLRRLADALHRAGLGMVLDIVPNHLAASSENRYWVDVLTHGRRSRFARWFDIDWDAGRDRVVLPVLADRIGRELERQKIAVGARGGRLEVRYGTQVFPVDPATLPPGMDRSRSARAVAAALQGPAGRSRLRRLLAAQPYRLVFWRLASREINYRRFFTINDLVGVRVEDPAVFAATHHLLLRWVSEGFVDGLRIDHVDGLLDPLGYLRRLRRAVARAGRPALPLFVEKILGRHESLARDWPVAGTTGYDFLAEVEDLLIDARGLEQVARAYRSFAGGPRDFATVARWGKRKVLREQLASDVRRLVALIPGTRPREAEHLARAVREVIVQLPVYRTYVRSSLRKAKLAARALLTRAVGQARREGRARPWAIDRVVRALERREFLQRFQQLCVPATAKGVEDTAFYAYVPLLSRNEVGGDPGVPLQDAVVTSHDAARRRATRWPDAQLAVTTHDTKRSADVRARLDVLTELPHDWAACVRRWHSWNRPLRRRQAGVVLPDPVTEYLVYQSLVGVWPLEDAPLGSLRSRLEAYALKAAREAKRRTSWRQPDPAFESALLAFVRDLLDPVRSAHFLADIRTFVTRIAPFGLWNALARTLVQLTAPGVPDTYQGDEAWTFALVDPDNRRPVDFARRQRALAALRRRAAHDQHRLLATLMSHPADPRCKQYLLWRLLSARRAHPDLFRRGDYLPLRAVGTQASHVVAYARRRGDAWAVAVAPRHTVSLLRGAAAVPVGAVWGDTRVRLPARWARTGGREAVSGRLVGSVGRPGGTVLYVRDLLAEAPVALLLPDGRRAARTSALGGR